MQDLRPEPEDLPPGRATIIELLHRQAVNHRGYPTLGPRRANVFRLPHAGPFSLPARPYNWDICTNYAWI